MNDLFMLGLTNALVATVLAIAVWCVTRVWRPPALVALLWTLVLVKLITPPLVAIPWRFERTITAGTPAVDTTRESNEATSVAAPVAHTPTNNSVLPEHIAIATNEP